MRKILIGIILAFLITSLPITFADDDPKIEFAGYLEETLGHFWAIEQNLDENNAELALVHAAHPIAELYLSMKPELRESNPEFDIKMQKTLMDLGKKTGQDVSREQAQNAIDDAKTLVEDARILVIGEEMSNDPIFKIDRKSTRLNSSH